jgi:hypothetical protein
LISRFEKKKKNRYFLLKVMFSFLPRLRELITYQPGLMTGAGLATGAGEDAAATRFSKTIVASFKTKPKLHKLLRRRYCGFEPVRIREVVVIVAATAFCKPVVTINFKQKLLSLLFIER